MLLLRQATAKAFAEPPRDWDHAEIERVISLVVTRMQEPEVSHPPGVTCRTLGVHFQTLISTPPKLLNGQRVQILLDCGIKKPES
jgi:hypothetical protein